MSGTVVWKHPLPDYFVPGAPFVLPVPSGAEVLAVAVQHDAPCLWARHRADDPIAGGRRCVVVGTGQPIPAGDWRHVGTWQAMGGYRVWHLFAEAGS